MNNVCSIFLLIAAAFVFGCNSDDNGTSPGNPNIPGGGSSSIVWDDWYWEFTFDTITFRCEGFYPKSIADEDRQEMQLHFFNNYVNGIYSYSGINNSFGFQIRDRSHSSWISGDEMSIGIDIINSPPQTSMVEARPPITFAVTSAFGLGQEIQNYINDNFTSSSPGGFVIMTSCTDTINLFNYSSECSVPILYTPGSYVLLGSDAYESEPAIGEMSYTLYAWEFTGDQFFVPLGSVNCTLRFKGPVFWYG